MKNSSVLLMYQSYIERLENYILSTTNFSSSRFLYYTFLTEYINNEKENKKD